MTKSSSLQMSQGYEVLPPRAGKAYPILIEEWEYLKTSIGVISEGTSWYDTVGWMLLGAFLSTLIAIATDSFADPDASKEASRQVVAYAVAAVTFLSGGVCVLFAREKRKLIKTKASDVVKQMDVIEQRYQDEPGDV